VQQANEAGQHPVNAVPSPDSVMDEGTLDGSRLMSHTRTEAVESFLQYWRDANQGATPTATQIAQVPPETGSSLAISGVVTGGHRSVQPADDEDTCDYV
jgi:hypothetical protein